MNLVQVNQKYLCVCVCVSYHSHLVSGLEDKSELLVILKIKFK